MRYLPAMLIAWVPILAIVLGLLLWALSKNPIVMRAGEIVFTCGTLVTLFVLAHVTVRLG
jgi:hypothetical protein